MLTKLRIVSIVVLFAYVFVHSYVAYAWWDEFLPGNAVSLENLSEGEKKEKQAKDKEENEAQNREAKVINYLEKARGERAKDNYKKARSLAESALKTDETSRKVKAFLSQLDAEEKLYLEEREQRTEYRVQKEEEKKRLKEEERRKREEEKEAKRKAQEEEKKAPEKEIKAKEEVVTPQAEELVKEEASVEVKEEKVEPALEERLKEKEREAREHVEKGEVKRLSAEEEARLWKEARVEVVREPKEKKEEEKKEKAIEDHEEKLIGKLNAEHPIIVDGDKVEYFEKSEKIIAEGNVVIVYGDVRLTCDRVEVNTKTREAMCEGNVLVEEPQGSLTGERIQYDFANKRGKITGGEIEAYPWYGYADDSKRVGPNEFLLKKGYITTCDQDVPHYRIKAREIRIFPNDLIIAKDIIFQIGDVPILYWPHYFHPIIQSRAKVQFIPGRSSEWGNFLLSATRLYMIGNTRVDVLADYRDRKGFAEGANIYYDMKDIGLPTLGKGIVRMYYIQQNAKNTRDPDEYRDYGRGLVVRKRLQWKHRIDFDKDTVGMLQFNKMTDENVLKDYFYDEYRQNRQRSEAESFISFISTKDNFILDIEANKRFSDYETVVQRLPEIKLNIPSQSLWNSPFYYESEWSATKFHRVYTKNFQGGANPYFRANESAPPELVNRADMFHKLSYYMNLRWFQVTPFMSFRETLYSRNRWDDGNRLIDRAVIEAGANSSTRLFRVFDINTNFLWLDINKIRHIISPTIQYLHRHQPTVDPNNLYQMDGLDSLAKENFITFSLENKLQTKRHTSPTTFESVDLARLIATTDYHFSLRKGRFFEAEDGSLYRKHGRFRNLRFDLEFTPYDWLFIDTEILFTPKNEAFSTGSIEGIIDLGEPFQAAFGYEYEKRMPEPRQDFTFDFTWKITPKWSFGLYERIDWAQKIIEEQQISITRDLHCWKVDLVYDVEGSRFFRDQYTLWLAFTIKAFPDLPIGLRQTFRKRLPGRLSPREKAATELSGG